MLKKFRWTIFIIIFLIGTIGVINSMNKEQKEPSIKEEVEKYMKDKYNEEFKVLGGGTEGWNETTMDIYVSSEKFPDAEIMIRRSKESGGMVDNYMEYLMQSKIEETMNKIVSEVYPKSKVLYSTNGPPHANATPQMSVDEYLKDLNNYSALSFKICINDPDCKTTKDQKLEQLRKKFEKNQYSPGFIIYYVLDGKLDLINANNANQLLNGVHEDEWWILRGDFGMDKSYKFRYVQWRDIKK
jgi:hypothetical protein